MSAVPGDPAVDLHPRDARRFTRTFASGDVIFEEATPGRCMYVILDGTVDIRHGSGDAATTIATLGSGDCFGEIALLEEGVRIASAHAVADPTVVIEIDKPRFIYLVGQQPAFALTVMRSLARKVGGRT